jgi:hypothetical protein
MVRGRAMTPEAMSSPPAGVAEPQGIAHSPWARQLVGAKMGPCCVLEAGDWENRGRQHEGGGPEDGLEVLGCSTAAARGGA